MIKVSIILPSLNVNDYIDECMQSVLNQTLADIEIICVDAGSKDGTREKLADHAKEDRRIRIIDSDVKSYGYQMNLGIREAKGEYIGIVETDDYIHPDTYERMYCAAKEKDLDLVKTDFNYFIDFNGKRVFAPYFRDIEDNYNKVISLKETPYALRFPQQNAIWSGIYRRDLIEKNAIYFHESPGASYQDTGFALLFTMYADRIMFLSDRLYNYRQDNAGASVRNDSKYAIIAEEYGWIYEEMTKRGLLGEYFQALYGHFRLVSYEWNLGRLSEEAGEKFLAHIKNENAPDYDGTLVGEDPEWRSRTEKCLSGDRELSSALRNNQAAQRRTLRTLLDLEKRSEKIVIVPAGRIAGAVVEFFGGLGVDKVVSLADNSIEKQGEKTQGFAIESVESAIQKYSDASFLVAMREGSDQIIRQLTDAGIKRDRIECITSRPLTGRALLTQIGGL